MTPETPRATQDGPKRIQRKRTKGWKMPEGAVYVGRPTVYGNPFRVGDPRPGTRHGARLTADDAVALYRAHHAAYFLPEALLALRGKDLACFCPLDQPCHADVLLELANRD